MTPVAGILGDLLGVSSPGDLTINRDFDGI